MTRMDDYATEHCRMKLKRTRNIENVDDYERKLKRVRNENFVEVEDILTDILVRLPVKSLLVCKSVCRHWRDLICSRSFILLHLMKSRQNSVLIVYPNPLTELCKIFYSKVDGTNFLGDMIGCFNGLICCYYSHIWYKDWYKQILICNPARREVLLLPETHSPRSEKPPTGGVCFGPPLDGYKVFQFFCIKEKHLYECQIYSSHTGSWKSIGSVKHAPLSSQNHVYINGMVYWLSTSMIGGQLVTHILAVDWEEKFSIIRLPKENPAAGDRCFLINLDGCLSLVIVSGDRFEMWTSQKKRQQYVWVQKLSCNDVPKELFMDNGPIFVVARAQQVDIVFRLDRFFILYSLKSSSWRIIPRSRGWSLPFVPVECPYSESLLHCNGRNVYVAAKGVLVPMKNKLKQMRNIENVDDYGWKLKCMRNENVVEVKEILTNILVRLPVKSLLVCKSVCRHWRDMICSPSFIVLHLMRSRQKPAPTGYSGPLLKLCQNFYSRVDGEIPGMMHFFSDMIGCCNGLICCYSSCSGYKDWFRQLLMFNPATREVFLLPGTYCFLSTKPPTGGVCFGPPLEGYKVFLFFCIKKNRRYQCKIYSSSTGSWKSIGYVNDAPSSSRNYVYINGTVFWLSTSMIKGQLVDHILVVDWKEKFSIIFLPKENPTAGDRSFLIKLQGCLAFAIVSGGRFKMWTLHTRCRQYFWVQRLSRDDVPIELFMDGGPLLLVPREQEDDIVFMTKRFYILYILKSSSWISGNGNHFRRSKLSIESFEFPYTESLLPCNGRFDSVQGNVSPGEGGVGSNKK